MNQPPLPDPSENDDALRVAFRSWKAQERTAAPIFPGLTALESTKRRSSPGRLSPAFALVAVACAVAMIITAARWHNAPKPPVSLAQTLPEPLLKPPTPNGFLSSAGAAWLSQPDPSDFLLPSFRHSPSLQVP